MLDVFSRAWRHPIDYLGITRITALEFQERIQETDTIYSFIFSAPKLPAWKAGQHAIFTLPSKRVEGKTWRPFSVAAAPHENVIRIDTIISPEPSSFKQNLMSLQPGDPVRMFGPYGELYLRPRMKKVVAIAGGIGITPFRSIIAVMAHKGSNIAFHLIYSAKAEHVYQADLEKWKAKLPNLEITYTATSDEVNAALEKEITKDDNNTHYLLSGAPGMIEALCQSLLDHGIKQDHILHDPFKGY